MSSTVPIWAVAIDDASVTAVRVRRSPEGALDLLAWWTVPVPAGADPLPVAIEALRRRSLQDHGLHIVLPSRGAACRSYRISPDDADLTAGELEHELHDLTPFDPSEVHLRFRRLGGPEDLDFRVVTEKRAEFVRWQKALEEGGFRYFGFSLGPAAELAALETLKIGPSRGFLLTLHGHWSTVTSLQGGLTVRYPIPFGIHDLARRLPVGGGGVSLEEALDALAGNPSTEAAWQALRTAAAPLLEDFRRAVEFHRETGHTPGEETVLLAGAGSDRPGLRAAFADASPLPLHALLKADNLAPFRPGPRFGMEEVLLRFPVLLPALGAALTATQTAPRDLDFRNLPEDLPAPPERSLFPVAAVLLLAAVGASFLLAEDACSLMDDALAALEALPNPPPAGEMSPGEAMGKAERLRVLVERTSRQAALARAFRETAAVFPKQGEENPMALRTERIRVLPEGAGYRLVLTLAAGGGPGRDLAPDIDRLVGRLEPLGWSRVEGGGRTVTLERREGKKGPR